MIPYIVFSILILLFRKYKKHFLIYITLMMFNVLRYDTGWDYMTYYDTIEMWGNASVGMDRYNFLWSWFFSVAQSLNNPHLVMAVSGFLTITILYYAIIKIQVVPSKICDTLTIYALWPFFYLASFSVIRQALALAIALFVFYCAINNKKCLFVLLLVMDFFIHSSSIVCALYAVFFLKDFRIKSGYMVLIAIGLVIIFRSLEWLLNNPLLIEYMVYLGHADSFGSKLGILMGLMLIPAFMLRSGRSNLGVVQRKGVIDVMILSFILTIIIYIGLSNSFMTRIMDYFMILLIFVAPEFKNLFADKQFGNVVVYSVFAGVFIVYLIITMDAQASSSYVPYKCILFR